MTIKVLLVDDHTVVRSGLSKFLMVNKDLKLVGEASDGAEAIGADFHLSSTPGAGTCVEVIWNENPEVRLHVL